MGWIIRILLVVAGLIASLFIERDALNFEVIQMTIATLLFAIVIFIIAFWPQIKMFLKKFL